MKHHPRLSLAMSLLVVALALLISSQTLWAQGGGRGHGRGDGVCIDSFPKEPLSDFEKESLTFMREEEKLAHDVYLVLGEQWSAKVFKNIAESEAQHTAMIAKLLEKYELADPAQTNAGVFTNQTLQALYDQLVTAGKVSLTEAYQVGATIEDLDIFDLKTALQTVDNQDLRTVYQNLMKGSRNHLRSFYKLLLNAGITYTAQYLSAEELTAIVTTPHERGPVDADGNPLTVPGGRGQNRHGRKGGHRFDMGFGPKIWASNYPNPGNPTTQITYTITEAAPVKISIFNIQGQMIRTYDLGHQAAGNYQQLWDARDQFGVAVASGTYIYSIRAGANAVTQRLSLVK